MASLSTTSSTSTTSSISSYIHGYTGLASGLDTEALIESMTTGTRSKIATQKQKQTKLTWTQTAIRNITDLMYNFTNTYTSYSSASNLTSSTLFSRSKVAALGANSSKVSVSGAATTTNLMSIARVKQLAKNATMTASVGIDPTLKTGDLLLGAAAGTALTDIDTGISTVAGQTLSVKYGDETYEVKIGDIDLSGCTTDAEVAAATAQAVNDALAETTVKDADGNEKKLSDVMSVTADENGNFKFEAEESVSFSGTGSADILKNLGFEVEEDPENEGVFTVTGADGEAADTHLTKSLAEKISGQRMQFAYNGTATWITLDDYTDGSATLADVAKDLQTQLDKTYGSGRIAVGIEDGGLTFTTIKAGTGTKDADTGLYTGYTVDSSSTFAITSDSAFGVKSGTANRVNLSGTLEDMDAANASLADADGNYTLSINGVSITVGKDESISSIISKINSNEDMGVKVEYQSLTNQFVLTSTEDGASGGITFDTVTGEDGTDRNIASALFGAITDDNYTAGQDAVLSVQYAGSSQEVEITRGTNTLTMDGLSITLKEAFGYDADGNAIDTEAVSFEASVDADAAVSAVKGMIDAYNELVDLVNTELTTKPDRDYQPLTDEQKAEMTESEITAWEEKANSGLLFGDSDLRMLSDALRSVVSGKDRITLMDMGISTSTSYSDNGKLVFDEDAFRAALEEDPDAVYEVLNRESDGTTQDGLLTKINSVMEQYGSTTGATKGILVTRAGSTHAPTTILSNSIQTEIDDLDDYIDQLNDKLQTEIDRYSSQFTLLETLIAQMNSQASYLSSLYA